MILKPGDILLTSGVGGAEAKWRDKALTNIILFNQKIQQRGFNPSRSHAELIMDEHGTTFAARWRTRKRENGLADYIGSNVTIGRSLSMNEKLFNSAWLSSELWQWEGNIYPVHRIITQLIGTWVLPWLVCIGFSKTGICSEVISKFYYTANKINEKYSFVESEWRGLTPADIEREVRYGDEFEVIYDGELTKKLLNESGLSLFQFESRKNNRENENENV